MLLGALNHVLRIATIFQNILILRIRPSKSRIKLTRPLEFILIALDYEKNSVSSNSMFYIFTLNNEADAKRYKIGEIVKINLILINNLK